MIPALKTLKQLIFYVMVAFLILKTPIGVFFLAQLPLIGKYEYCLRVWLWIDVGICTILHGTRDRTISGWTGQHMSKYKRYYYQGMIINWLFVKVGAKPNHCQVVWRYERRKLAIL